MLVVQSVNESILDMLHLANEHLVLIWSSAYPLRKWKCSEVVASTDVEKCTPQVIYSMISLAADAIQNYGNEQASFVSAGNVVDAHGSNWKALLAASTHAASSYLPKELMDEFPVVDFNVVHIFVNLATGLPIVNIPDLLHLTKNTITALEY